MTNKKDILRNINNYSPDEIADAVRNGVVSMYELGKETEGAFTPLLKKKVKELLANSTVPIVKESEEKILKNKETIAPSKPVVTEDSFPEQLDVLNIIDDSQVTQENLKATETDIKKEPGMFRNPFSFTGRIRRTEYGISLIICFFLNFFMEVIISITADSNTSSALVILYFIILVPYLWFIWAQGAKRCHDRGNSGWLQIIPFYGLWMIFAEGDAGTNKYGNSPK